MKRTIVLTVGLITLSVIMGRNFAQSSPAAKLATLAPPTNVRVEAGENAIKVMWGASPDEAGYGFDGPFHSFLQETIPCQLRHEHPEPNATCTKCGNHWTCPTSRTNITSVWFVKFACWK